MPLDVELQSSAPGGKNHHAEIIFLQDVAVNVSSSSIRTITATLSSLSPPKVGLLFFDIQYTPWYVHTELQGPIDIDISCPRGEQNTTRFLSIFGQQSIVHELASSLFVTYCTHCVFSYNYIFLLAVRIKFLWCSIFIVFLHISAWCK